MVWERIVDGVGWVAALLDRLLAPLNAHLGPAMMILIITITVVALTKLLSRVYNTQRHAELKANYEHWFALRQAAMACDDRDKGNGIAKNIDQAQLNKAYYDYFFEGFLKSIITTMLPILFAAAYVNRAYAPDNLMQQIGRKVIFRFTRAGGEPVMVSAFFWFVICLFLVYLAWFIIGSVVRSYGAKHKAGHSDPNPQ